MAQQYDFQAGLQLNALSSITREQLLQAISQITPLSNIGGVIIMSSGGGVTSPDLTANPRFARYVWLDTYYDPIKVMVHDQTGIDAYSSWDSIGLGEDSIESIHVKQDAVALYDGATKKVALNESGADLAKKWYAVRVDSAGQRIEVVPVDSLVGDAGGLGVTRLVGGTDNQFIRMDAGTVVWETVNFAAELAAGSVSLSKLVGVNPGYLLRVAVGGAIEEVSNGAADLLANGSVLPVKLSGSGVSTGYILRYNGVAWEAVSPPLGFTSTALISTNGVVGGSYIDPTGAFSDSVSHGLGAVVPKLVRVVLYCASDDNGYITGDEVDLSAMVWNDNVGANENDGWQAITFSADTTSIRAFSPTVGLHRWICPKSGGAPALIGSNCWKVKFYAWT